MVMADTEQFNPHEPLDAGLTCIHRRRHCVATQDTDGDDELDRIEIDNFLDTLAEIAMSIAKRKEENPE